MKKRNIILVPVFALLMLGSCKEGKDNGAQAETDPIAEAMAADSVDIPMRQVTVGQKTYNVADIDDSARVYKDNVDRSRCFIVISKKEYRLYVYEVSADQKDTTLVAHFPVCYAKYPEAKTQSGDMRTPESSMQEPFTIKQIQDASDWHHDFGDGRGSIKSYGNWFLRLDTPGFTGVGIHGSTNNEASVPGRDSEGCIRLRDADLIVLHDRFAQEGHKVVIKGIKQGKLPFELKAEQALAERYKAPKAGYKTPVTTEPQEETGPAIPENDGSADIAPTSPPPSASSPDKQAEPAKGGVNPSLGARPSDKELEKLKQKGGIKPSKEQPKKK